MALKNQTSEKNSPRGSRLEREELEATCDTATMCFYKGDAMTTDTDNTPLQTQSSGNKHRDAELPPYKTRSDDNTCKYSATFTA